MHHGIGHANTSTLDPHLECCDAERPYVRFEIISSHLLHHFRSHPTCWNVVSTRRAHAWARRPILERVSHRAQVTYVYPQTMCSSALHLTPSTARKLQNPPTGCAHRERLTSYPPSHPCARASGGRAILSITDIPPIYMNKRVCDSESTALACKMIPAAHTCEAAQWSADTRCHAVHP